MPIYWNFLFIMFFLHASPKCFESEPSTLQIGSYTQFVEDKIASFCKNIDVTLPTNESSYSHMASFMRMEQFFGVMFGMKHFQVSSKYLPKTHQLSLISIFYAKYEWKLVQINYLVSSDPQIFVGTFIMEEWNAENCQSDLIQQTGFTSFPVPNIQNSTAIVMLKGMTCYTENCAVTNLKWELNDGIIALTYKYTLKYDFSRARQPMKAHFIYIIFGSSERYFIQYFPHLRHESTTRAGRAFNNYIIDEDLSLVSQTSDNYTNLFIGLSEIGSVLNRYLVLKIQQRVYEEQNFCFSLIECEEYKICGNCSENQTFSEGSCECISGYARNEDGQCLKGEADEGQVQCQEQSEYYNGNECVECEKNCKVCSKEGKCVDCKDSFSSFEFEGRLRCFSIH